MNFLSYYLTYRIHNGQLLLSPMFSGRPKVPPVQNIQIIITSPHNFSNLAVFLTIGSGSAKKSMCICSVRLAQRIISASGSKLPLR